MNRSVAAGRAVSALDESCSTKNILVNTVQREDSGARALNETRARAYNVLDVNRNYRQISILLTYRGIKLIEESQLLMKQRLEFHESIWTHCQQTVARSFALLSNGRKQDSNEPY